MNGKHRDVLFVVARGFLGLYDSGACAWYAAADLMNIEIKSDYEDNCASSVDDRGLRNIASTGAIFASGDGLSNHFTYRSPSAIPRIVPTSPITREIGKRAVNVKVMAALKIGIGRALLMRAGSGRTRE
jgi:hypothetical protein